MKDFFKIEIEYPELPSIFQLLNNIGMGVEKDEDEQILKLISKARQEFNSGKKIVYEDVSAIYSRNNREVLLENYIQFMAMSLSCLDFDDLNGAWFNYSKASYYRGTVHSWDFAFDHFTNEDVKRYELSSKSKLKESNIHLIDCLMQIASKPNAAWKNKKIFIETVYKELGPMFDKLGIDKKLIPKDLDRKIYSLMRTHYPLYEAYEKNCQKKK